MRGDCKCPRLEYVASQVADNPTHPGQIEHLYRCRKCEWKFVTDKPQGLIINREEESRGEREERGRGE